MVNGLKALLIQPDGSQDIGDVIQIAKKEGARLFYKSGKIKVLEVVHSRYGEVVVVQNGNGCISEQTKKA